MLTQVISSSLDLADQLGEADLVLETLDFGYVTVVAFVFLDREVDCVDIVDDLAWCGDVGCPVGGDDLADDDERQGQGCQDEDDGPLQPARGGHVESEVGDGHTVMT